MEKDKNTSYVPYEQRKKKENMTPPHEKLNREMEKENKKINIIKYF